MDLPPPLAIVRGVQTSTKGSEMEIAAMIAIAIISGLCILAFNHRIAHLRMIVASGRYAVFNVVFGLFLALGVHVGRTMENAYEVEIAAIGVAALAASYLAIQFGLEWLARDRS